MRVGIAYNLKRENFHGPHDAEAEFDDPDTIMAIKKALETAGHRVELFEALESFPASIAASRPDIVFNIAEGRLGRGREAHVPAILNFLNIPFVGSDETAVCIAMDKALAKRLLASFGVDTPKYTVITGDTRYTSGNSASSDQPEQPGFPIIVKPVAEGSGKGISGVSLVSGSDELHVVADELIRTYEQDALAEEYIPGREFTVGLLGNGAGTRVFAPMEVIFRDKAHSIYSYEIKRNFKQHIDYACPPDLDAGLISKLEETALQVFRITGCRDFARVDFRLSPENRLYFIEINPIPGLAPGYSDYPMLAGFCGVDYDTLICSILDSALTRYGLR